MKVCAVIAEYNPFHNGHAWQIRRARELLGADYVLAVMSGDFVQRGAPAIMEKHERAAMALRGGVDLVLELPVFAATGSAEVFALGAVSLLDALGVVDFLCFGTESLSDGIAAGKFSGKSYAGILSGSSAEGALSDEPCGGQLADAGLLRAEIVRILLDEPGVYRETIRDLQKEGKSFAAAREEAVVRSLGGQGSFFSEEMVRGMLSLPNNILALEYQKALLRLGSSIKPVAIPRRGGGYHDPFRPGGQELLGTESPAVFASASAIRSELAVMAGSDSAQDWGKAGCVRDTGGYTVFDALPLYCAESVRAQLGNNGLVFEDVLDPLLGYRLFMESEESVMRYADVSADLGRRIIRERNHCRGFLSYAQHLKTRNLAMTRIQRALLHILLNIEDAAGMAVPYARILGFRKDSSALLKKIQENSSIPLLTKAAYGPRLLSEEALPVLESSVFASNVYGMLLSRQCGQPFLHEYQKKVVLF